MIPLSGVILILSLDFTYYLKDDYGWLAVIAVWLILVVAALVVIEVAAVLYRVRLIQSASSRKRP
jgi:hypothetical protein